MTRRITSTLQFAAALSLSALVISAQTGCLISSRSSSKMTGEYVGSGAFSEVEVGVTTDEWLVAAFGEPTCRSSLSDGGELWKWSYTKTDSSSGAVLFLFGGSSSDVSTGDTCVELRDGIVTKKWRD